MARLALLGTLLATLLVACAPAPRAPILVAEEGPAVDYVADVEPILDARCVTCHSCYNAGCQLKLSSYEGVDRGGSKDPVYSASRLTHAAPSRLFMDATSTEEWRASGFHSVTRSDAPAPYNDSVMLHFLDAKRRQPLSEGDYQAEADDLTCAANAVEAGHFLAEHPGRGMPFGLPALSEREYATLATWLQQGAPGPSDAQQASKETPTPANAREIEKWEDFLNREDPKHAMTARYLYEHFFLAHLHFPEADGEEFFELVRSTTPPGRPLEVIATVRPYDDPGIDRFWYRLRKIHSTIVHKTHIVVPWSDTTLARYGELFIETEWLEPPHEELYDTKLGANPFVVFAQIPPRSRYRFLLDHAEYIMRTFIRGPVCKGQVALNVIHDHFWVMFIDPDADLTLDDPHFLVRQSSNLRLPTEVGSDERVLKAFSDGYRERYAAFYRAKSELYDEHQPEGMSIDAIWKGRVPEDSPVQTVYRHFDSASVHKGVLGGLPRTLWVIDYSQFERIYYSLVAGFDVYGNVAHQVNVRRYMDLLRVEGELNFLHFLPSTARLPLLESWYLGDDAIENVNHPEVLTDRGTQVTFLSDDPKRELVERVVNDHLLPEVGIEFDTINYHGSRDPIPMPRRFETHEDILDGFRALTAPGTGFIAHKTQSGVNLLYVRVRDYQGEDRRFTIVINRWHDNVNSMFGEGSALDPGKDTMDFLPGTIGSYPNYFFDIEAHEVPDFFDMLENFDGSEAYQRKVRAYGVNRSDPAFWEVFDWFQADFEASDPAHAGLYDLNRYFYKAMPGT